MISTLLLLTILTAALIVTKYKQYTKYVYYAAVLLFFAFAVRNIVRPALHSSHGPIFLNQELNWDFRVYYYAAKAYSSGMNPYIPENLSRLYGAEVLPFMYSPLTIFFFIPLTFLNYKLALSIFVIGKIILLGGLVLIWHLLIRNEYLRILLLVISVVGFNETVWSDFYNGNISLYEQFFLWTAIYFLIRGNVIFYCSAILIISLFKILFIVLLFIPMALSFTRQNIKAIIYMIAVFVILNVFSFFILQDIYSAFLNNAAGALNVYGFGVHDYSILVLIRTFVLPVLEKVGLTIPFMDVILYGVWFGLLSISAYLILRSSTIRNKPLLLVTYCLFLYTCISPRILDYFFILLIAPCLVVIYITLKSGAAQIISCLPIIFSFGIYQPILVTFILFASFSIYLIVIRKNDGKLSMLNVKYLSIITRNEKYSSK